MGTDRTLRKSGLEELEPLADLALVVGARKALWWELEKLW